LNRQGYKFVLIIFRRDAALSTQGSKFKMQQIADFSDHESQVILN